ELRLRETADILATVSRHKKRPALVIGFAAETENLGANARAKLKNKGCDWLLANDVGDGRVFGEDDTALILYTAAGEESWPRLSKHASAVKLTEKIAGHFNPVPFPKPKHQRKNA
ncbi:MAG: bifunctional phosphopantothenoylcysteine decarboxylase/phosphopantothenate synthase, partial [Alphaproteobacteria bacterium]|nr:bifunctional phosphopantothenoylcysteine decarboxylase/phosphopantothenate synthase [Alphaproteobacteria bacterium]